MGRFIGFLKSGTNRFYLFLSLGIVVCSLLVFADRNSRDIGVSRTHLSTTAGNVDPDQVEQFMVRNLKRTGLPGAAVAITQGDHVVYSAGFGKDAQGNQITAATRMYIGSISKSFTALAVMQLADDGKIEIDASAQKYLPEFALTDPRAHSITVKQLLNQSSGMGDRGFPEMSLPQPGTLEELVSSMRSAALVAAPGTQWAYHNPNYEVLARMVEVVSGESFHGYMEKHIFEPLAMDRSTSIAVVGGTEVDVPNGYTFVYGIPVERSALRHFSAGSGGLISSAGDLANWLIMQNHEGRFRDQQLVTADSIDALHTPSGPDNDYAFGWEQDVLEDGSRRIEHGGTSFTYSGNQAIFPATGEGFVVLFNSTSALGAEQLSFSDGLTAIVQGASPELGAPVGLVADTVLALLTVLVIFIGVHRLARAQQWAQRLQKRPVRLAVRLLPYLGGIWLFVFFPRIAGAIFGMRDVTWQTARYGWPVLVIFCATIALLSLAIIAQRLRSYAALLSMEREVASSR